MCEGPDNSFPTVVTYASKCTVPMYLGVEITQFISGINLQCMIVSFCASFIKLPGHECNCHDAQG